MKKVVLGIIIGIVLSVLTIVGYGLFIQFQLSNMKYEPQENLVAPIEIPENTNSNYTEIQDAEKPIIALFYVDWCGYCRRFMPIFGKYAKKHSNDFTFATINCDAPENKEIVQGNHVLTFPTLMIIDKKLNYTSNVNVAATQSEKVFEDALNNHLNLRKTISEIKK